MMDPVSTPSTTTFEIVLVCINIIVLVISGLVGIIVNGLKATIAEIKSDIKGLVCEPICKARMDSVEKDVNNIGAMVRNHSHD